MVTWIVTLTGLSIITTILNSSWRSFSHRFNSLRSWYSTNWRMARPATISSFSSLSHLLKEFALSSEFSRRCFCPHWNTFLFFLSSDRTIFHLVDGGDQGRSWYFHWLNCHLMCFRGAFLINSPLQICDQILKFFLGLQRLLLSCFPSYIPGGKRTCTTTLRWIWPMTSRVSRLCKYLLIFRSELIHTYIYVFIKFN